MARTLLITEEVSIVNRWRWVTLLSSCASDAPPPSESCVLLKHTGALIPLVVHAPEPHRRQISWGSVCSEPICLEPVCTLSRIWLAESAQFHLCPALSCLSGWLSLSCCTIAATFLDRSSYLLQPRLCIAQQIAQPLLIIKGRGLE